MRMGAIGGAGGFVAGAHTGALFGDTTSESVLLAGAYGGAGFFAGASLMPFLPVFVLAGGLGYLFTVFDDDCKKKA